MYGSLPEDAEFAITILTSLPDSWDNWVGSIDLVSVKSSEDIIARILQQNDTALPVVRHNGKRQHHQGDDQHLRNACFNCGRPGHRVHECRDKKNGHTYTDQENYDHYMLNKKHGGGGTSKANVASEEDSQDVVFMANLPRILGFSTAPRVYT